MPLLLVSPYSHAIVCCGRRTSRYRRFGRIALCGLKSAGACRLLHIWTEGFGCHRRAFPDVQCARITDEALPYAARHGRQRVSHESRLSPRQSRVMRERVTPWRVPRRETERASSYSPLSRCLIVSAVNTGAVIDSEECLFTRHGYCRNRSSY